MSLADKVKGNLQGFKNRAKGLKDKVTGKFKDKIDAPLGIMIHREIAAMFFWDDKVTDYVQQIVDLTREGKKDEAAEISKNKLHPYIYSKLNRDRRYKNRMDEVNEKLKNKSEEIKDKASGFKNPAKLLSWIKKRNKELEEQQ